MVPVLLWSLLRAVRHPIQPSVVDTVPNPARINAAHEPFLAMPAQFRREAAAAASVAVAPPKLGKDYVRLRFYPRVRVPAADLSDRASAWRLRLGGALGWGAE